MTNGNKRLEPLERNRWSDEVAELLAGTVASTDAIERQGSRADAEPRTRPLEILRYLAHSPHLLKPFLPWATAIAIGGSLDRRHAELLALRAAWNCRSDFEWGHHVEYAEAFGLPEADVARIPAGPDADGWTAPQAALLRAADELHVGTDVSEATWEALAEHFSPAELVEAVMTVGQYTMLSMVANTFAVELEDGYETLPDPPG